MDVTSSPDKQKQPKSSFNLCEQLVAENLDPVESFSGFPSLIGEKIFRSAIKCHKFSDHNYAQLSLKLFTEAFEEEMLRSLNLSKEHVGLNYYIEDFLMFKHLVEIDVSCCGLGDDHEILVHISALQSLQSLVLSNNALSDQGIQKMTTPYRMFQRGPEHLAFIDLTGNAISLKVLKFLSCFSHLQSLLLPLNPCFEQQEHGGWAIKTTSYEHHKIVTTGWAAEVINTWLSSARTRTKAKQPVKKSFYSRVPLKDVSLEETDKPESVCLLATKTASEKKQICSSAINKRKRQVSGKKVDNKVVVNSGSECTSPPDCDELTEFDSELMDLYKCGGTGKSSTEPDTASFSKHLHGLSGQDSSHNARTVTDYQSNQHERKFVCDIQKQNITAIRKQSLENGMNTFQSGFVHSKKGPTGILDSLPNKKRRLNTSVFQIRRGNSDN